MLCVPLPKSLTYMDDQLLRPVVALSALLIPVCFNVFNVFNARWSLDQTLSSKFWAISAAHVSLFIVAFLCEIDFPPGTLLLLNFPPEVLDAIQIALQVLWCYKYYPPQVLFDVIRISLPRYISNASRWGLSPNDCNRWWWRWKWSTWRNFHHWIWSASL